MFRKKRFGVVALFFSIKSSFGVHGQIKSWMKATDSPGSGRRAGRELQDGLLRRGINGDMFKTLNEEDIVNIKWAFQSDRCTALILWMYLRDTEKVAF